MKIGILGGTFNPIHLGHLLIAQDALEQAGLDRVRFIPCALPPHKTASPLAPARDRLRMIRLAIAGDERFEVDDLEIRRGGRSYSVETVAGLRRREPGVEWFFIIGADSLRDLRHWKEIDRLAASCRFIAVARPGVTAPRKISRQWKVTLVRGHPCDIASREIRARRARGRSIRYLVPEQVLRYIDRQKLYR